MRRDRSDYRGRHAERQREKRADEPGRDSAATMRWRNANREKYRAHQKVQYALRTKRLIRPTACEACGTSCKPHAHHADYARPLDVRWLCNLCHEREHHDN